MRAEPRMGHMLQPAYISERLKAWTAACHRVASLGASTAARRMRLNPYLQAKKIHGYVAWLARPHMYTTMQGSSRWCVSMEALSKARWQQRLFLQILQEWLSKLDHCV